MTHQPALREKGDGGGAEDAKADSKDRFAAWRVAAFNRQTPSIIIDGHGIGSLFPPGGHRRKNSAEFQDAKESLAAGIATVSRKTGNPLQIYEGSPFDAIAGNMFEIEIATSRAVRVKHVTQCHKLSAKPVIARMATPGSHPDEPPDEIIHGACATRAETVCTSAPGTDHSITTFFELAARIPKSSPVINRTLRLRCQV